VGCPDIGNWKYGKIAACSRKKFMRLFRVGKITDCVIR
jgi:hypothetical protein